jgi:short-subunit dehydrogenase
MDVNWASMVAEVVQSVLERTGHIDALVNNAGYVLVGALKQTSIQEAQDPFDTNFSGVMRVTQAVLPAMRRQGFGRIVNIRSVLGFLPAPAKEGCGVSLEITSQAARSLRVVSDRETGGEP